VKPADNKTNEELVKV